MELGTTLRLIGRGDVVRRNSPDALSDGVVWAKAEDETPANSMLHVRKNILREEICMLFLF